MQSNAVIVFHIFLHVAYGGFTRVVYLVADPFFLVVGAIGLKYGRTKKIRVAAWLGAIALFAYIVLVALTRQVLPFIA